jgi:hypothetical protein
MQYVFCTTFLSRLVDGLVSKWLSKSCQFEQQLWSSSSRALLRPVAEVRGNLVSRTIDVWAWAGCDLFPHFNAIVLCTSETNQLFWFNLWNWHCFPGPHLCHRAGHLTQERCFSTQLFSRTIDMKIKRFLENHVEIFASMDGAYSQTSIYVLFHIRTFNRLRTWQCFAIFSGSSLTNQTLYM